MRIVSALLLSLSALVPTPASASWTLAGDVSALFALEDLPEETGLALDLRGGYDFGAVVHPELALGYVHWPDLSAEDASEQRDMWRALVGLRIEGEGRIRPGAFAHVGWARFFSELEGGEPPGFRRRDIFSGFSADAGFGLDVHASRAVALGTHASYGFLNDGPVLHWAQIGLHVGLTY